MELKDVEVPQVGVLKDKGIKDAEHLDKVLRDADKMAGEKAELERKLREMEEAQLAEPEDEPEVPQSPAPPPVDQAWGLDAQAAQEFQSEFMSNGLKAVSNVARFWAKHHADELANTNIKNLEGRLTNIENTNAWFEASDELNQHFNEDFLERHKGDIFDFIKKHADKAPKDGELFKHVALIEKKELKSAEKVDGDQAVADVKSRKAFMEGEGDAAPKTGVDFSSMEPEEMEKYLPKADPTKPIVEGE